MNNYEDVHILQTETCVRQDVVPQDRTRLKQGTNPFNVDVFFVTQLLFTLILD